MKALTFAVLAILAFGGTGLAIAEPQAARWLKIPDGDDMAANWPSDRGVEGRVLMHCMVKIDGKLDRCSILQEFPKAKGFGAATLRLSRIFRSAPLKEEGEILMPISWRLPGHPRTSPPIVEHPPWVSVPSKADIAAAYPFAAVSPAVGTVSVRCYAMDDGTFNGCMTISAVPAGAGFEDAALSLTKKFQLSEAWRSQVADVLQVQFPIEMTKN